MLTGREAAVPSSRAVLVSVIYFNCRSLPKIDELIKLELLYMSTFLFPCCGVQSKQQSTLLDLVIMYLSAT